MSIVGDVVESVVFVSKNKEYKITMRPIQQGITPHGMLTVVDPGKDICFHNHQYSTSDPKEIDFLKSNFAYKVDFWEEKSIPAATKQKLDAAFGGPTKVKEGVMDSVSGPGESLDAERKQLAADRAKFEKEKADFEQTQKAPVASLDGQRDGVPEDESLNDVPEEPEAPSKPAPSKKAKKKAKARKR